MSKYTLIGAVVLAAVISAWGAGVLAQIYVDDRAATVGQSYAQGMGDVMRSKGIYNLTTSEAAINMTEARKRDIENRQQWTDAYFDIRAANRKHREAERGPRPSMEKLVRYAQAGTPKRLSPGELDSVSGRIFWPRLLMTDAFADSREQLEPMFQEWARQGAANSEELARIQQATGQMTAELKAQIQTASSTDYLAARRFLESLAYEAQLPAR